MRTAKTVFISLVGVGFLVASVVLALSARGYQISGQPMPNGKGGFMEFYHGYLFAIALFLFSVVWFMVAHRCWRSHS